MKRPYPAYKNSGISWIDQIPTHWEILKGKWLFKKMHRPIRDEDGVVTVFRDGMVTLRSNRRVEGFTNSLKEIGYQGIRKGDLVIHQMDAFAGSIGVSDSDGKSTPVYSVCLPIDDANPTFYSYLLRQMAQSQWILALAKGIRERSSDFRFNEFANQEYPVPPAEEQQAIVDFIEDQTAVIDKFITNKQRLIALLEEQKQAVINTAVTQGLNTAVSRKPSGVDWLSDIPAHWKIERAKHLFNESRLPVRAEDEIVTCFRDGQVTLRKNRRTDGFMTALLETGYQGIRKGQLVIHSMDAFAGAIGVSDSDGKSTPEYVVCDPKDNQIISKYYVYLLREMARQNYIEILCTAVRERAPRLRFSRFSTLHLPVPPKNDQKKIVIHIEETLATINTTIERTQREIDLIKEYRITLIANAVTGKIDVHSHQEDT